MPSFINLNNNGLRHSKQLAKLAKNKPIYEDGNTPYNIFTNYSKDVTPKPQAPKTMVEWLFYAQEIMHTLYVNTVNKVSEFILSTVDNES